MSIASRIQHGLNAYKGKVVLIKHVNRISDRAQAFLKHQIDIQKAGGAKANIQFVCTTSVDMKEAIREGRFRSDLYYALKTVDIRPLQERKEDISTLLKYYLKEKGYSNLDQCLEPGVKRALLSYTYPDNVSELQRIIGSFLQEKQVNGKQRVDLDCLPQEVLFRDSKTEDLALHEFRRAAAITVMEFIERALKETHGQKAKAAALMGIRPDDLRYMALKHERAFPGLIRKFPATSHAYKNSL